MATRFRFDDRFDGAPATFVAGVARRWRSPARVGAGARFSYPPLDPPAAPCTPADPPAPPPPTFSEAELAAAVAAARSEGRTEAEAEIRAGLEHRRTEALAAIAAGLAQGQAAFERTLAARAGASGELALALARALVPRALARQPLADVEAMLQEVVARLEGCPWLELRLAPDLVEAGRAALARAAAEAGYRGEIRVIADAKLAPGDARLEWQDGAAVRDLARLEAEASALVEAWLPAERTCAGSSQAGAAHADGASTDRREP
jgi:flagellar assembly protein FliH